MQSNRRDFLNRTAALATLPWWFPQGTEACQVDRLQIAPFQFGVTPPMGHPLCGGWIKPVEAVDDPLLALGILIEGAGDPIILCAVDWTGILNRSHLAWRKGLADACGTTADRVAVQCVHQHNAPFACVDAEKLAQAQGDLPHVVEIPFFEECLKRGAEAVKQARHKLKPLTHIGTGQARVEKVASNRRILNHEGKLADWRGSSSKIPAHQEAPEGLIDPFLKTVAFFSGEEKLAECHYYATHPMSFYGDGRVTSDFVGIARAARQKANPSVQQLYFTGCSGNVAAGKYNDGTPEARKQLTERIALGMEASSKSIQKEKLESISWKTRDILPETRSGMTVEKLEQMLADKNQSTRNRVALHLAWLKRRADGLPITLSALHINRTTLLHLPAESFIEYQLRAQQAAPERFVAVAAYGDGGPWYLPVKEAYPQGGYEVSVALCEPSIDDLLTGGSRELLQAES